MGCHVTTAVTDWVDGVLDPDDINDIRGNAEQIVRDDGTYLQIELYAPIESAREFLDTYEQAQEGHIMAMFEMLTFLGIVADTFRHGLGMEPDDI